MLIKKQYSKLVLQETYNEQEIQQFFALSQSNKLSGISQKEL